MRALGVSWSGWQLFMFVAITISSLSCWSEFAMAFDADQITIDAAKNRSYIGENGETIRVCNATKLDRAVRYTSGRPYAWGGPTGTLSQIVYSPIIAKTDVIVGSQGETKGIIVHTIVEQVANKNCKSTTFPDCEVQEDRYYGCYYGTVNVNIPSYVIADLAKLGVSLDANAFILSSSSSDGTPFVVILIGFVVLILLIIRGRRSVQ